MGYTRFFLPLENEASGYEFMGRRPAGRVIVENRDGRGQVSVWLQDIKTETRYGVYLIFADGARFAGVHIHTLAPGGTGKAEARKDFGLDALGGFALDELVGVAVVVADGLSRAQPVSPLCGYRGKPVSWRGNFYEKNSQREPVSDTNRMSSGNAVASEPKVAEVPEIQGISEEVPESTCKVKILDKPVQATEPEPIPEARHTIEAEPVAEPIVAPVVEPQKKPPPVRQTAPRARKPAKKIDTGTENIMTMKSIFNSKPHIRPFKSFDREATWVQLAISDAVPLPHNRPLLLEEPFVRAAYASHNHLLLGLAGDGKEYILGVPGDYNPEERPQAKRLGFTKFKTGASTPPKRGDRGYWLMFVDM